MAARYYETLTSLPALDGLGSHTISRSAMLGHVQHDPRVKKLLQIIFLESDLKQYDSAQANEHQHYDTAVLTESQLTNQSPLPTYLLSVQKENNSPHPTDRIWEQYFRYAITTSQHDDSAFLQEWLQFILAIRNGLVRFRCQQLDLDENHHLVAIDLDQTKQASIYDSMIQELAAINDPTQQAQKQLQLQWDWVCDHEMWFSFEIDELLAYAVKIDLMEQWLRITGEPTCQLPDSDLTRLAVSKTT